MWDDPSYLSSAEAWEQLQEEAAMCVFERALSFLSRQAKRRSSSLWSAIASEWQRVAQQVALDLSPSHDKLIPVQSVLGSLENFPLAASEGEEILRSRLMATLKTKISNETSNLKGIQPIRGCEEYAEVLQSLTHFGIGRAFLSRDPQIPFGIKLQGPPPLSAYLDFSTKPQNGPSICPPQLVFKHEGKGGGGGSGSNPLYPLGSCQKKPQQGDEEEKGEFYWRVLLGLLSLFEKSSGDGNVEEGGRGCTRAPPAGGRSSRPLPVRPSVQLETIYSHFCVRTHRGFPPSQGVNVLDIVRRAEASVPSSSRVSSPPARSAVPSLDTTSSSNWFSAVAACFGTRLKPQETRREGIEESDFILGGNLSHLMGPDGRRVCGSGSRRMAPSPRPFTSRRSARFHPTHQQTGGKTVGEGASRQRKEEEKDRNHSTNGTGIHTHISIARVGGAPVRESQARQAAASSSFSGLSRVEKGGLFSHLTREEDPAPKHKRESVSREKTGERTSIVRGKSSSRGGQRKDTTRGKSRERERTGIIRGKSGEKTVSSSLPLASSFPPPPPASSIIPPSSLRQTLTHTPSSLRQTLTHTPTPECPPRKADDHDIPLNTEASRSTTKSPVPKLNFQKEGGRALEDRRSCLNASEPHADDLYSKDMCDLAPAPSAPSSSIQNNSLGAPAVSVVISQSASEAQEAQGEKDQDRVVGDSVPSSHKVETADNSKQERTEDPPEQSTNKPPVVPLSPSHSGIIMPSLHSENSSEKILITSSSTNDLLPHAPSCAHPDPTHKIPPAPGNEREEEGQTDDRPVSDQEKMRLAVAAAEIATPFPAILSALGASVTWNEETSRWQGVLPVSSNSSNNSLPTSLLASASSLSNKNRQKGPQAHRASATASTPEEVPKSRERLIGWLLSQAFPSPDRPQRHPQPQSAMQEAGGKSQTVNVNLASVGVRSPGSPFSSLNSLPSVLATSGRGNRTLHSFLPDQKGTKGKGKERTAATTTLKQSRTNHAASTAAATNERAKGGRGGTTKSDKQMPRSASSATERALSPLGQAEVPRRPAGVRWVRGECQGASGTIFWENVCKVQGARRSEALPGNIQAAMATLGVSGRDESFGLPFFVEPVQQSGSGVRSQASAASSSSDSVGGGDSLCTIFVLLKDRSECMKFTRDAPRVLSQWTGGGRCLRSSLSSVSLLRSQAEEEGKDTSKRESETVNVKGATSCGRAGVEDRTAGLLRMQTGGGVTPRRGGLTVERGFLLFDDVSRK
uniref:Uncharacterized protein n=1 Tax=Chromera velia CCMP2878 TaxID=1169474 RepID=A0A0G4H7V7_9ALVE|eukprot:Cvel_5858.t1-p1 / transcript=Cvel_5858.t1 / gene=Cvel_5858 / organism=Chromera_velia_CCMP2878 / gene_product=hypothetical protein / transcript_product=hypothetical protein / location=Cvel_scaffold278:82625-88851(+) / protein_length=1251 / sequence_SO=supercontig / SO=protein_coding / is_pseudo=false